MEWVEKLYEETRKIYEENGKRKDGYAIFYSPVKANPKIALVGYNPGGGDESFNPDKITVPNVHEYKHENYKLARKIRDIFKRAGLEIDDTVKFNLIFFRSRKAHEMNDKFLIQFSEEKVMFILDQLKPRYIITEGFATFERLLTLRNGLVLPPERNSKGKRLILLGETRDGTKVIGLKHPSGARLSNEDLIKMAEYLKDHIV